MKVYYETKMNEIPKTCYDCKCEWCGLPLKNNRYEPEIKKQYLSKRHKDCPLKAIEED
jgi:hypothetical protein